jgi:hypothetical protein
MTADDPVAVEIERNWATPLGADRRPLPIPVPWAPVPLIKNQPL